MNKTKILINVVLFALSIIFILTGYFISNNVWSGFSILKEDTVGSLFLIIFLINISLFIFNIINFFVKKETPRILYIFFLVLSLGISAYSMVIHLAIEAFKNLRFI